MHNPLRPYNSRNVVSVCQSRMKYLLCLLGCCLFSLLTNAQNCPVTQQRKYATQHIEESSAGSVSEGEKSADANPKTASTLSIGLALLGGSATQHMGFSSRVQAGTPVSVKINYPSSLLGVGVTVTVQPFVYNGSGSPVATGRSWTASSLLALASAYGDFIMTVTPQNNSGVNLPYDGVSVKMSAAVGLGLSMNVYDAWIMETVNPAACNNPTDVLSGARAGAVQLLNATGGVTQPWDAIDDDPGLTTYATLNTGVQVLSQVFETVVFSTPSKPGDSLYIVLQDPGAALLDLGLLNGFRIQPYLGDNAVGAPITNSASLLNLRLLAGAGNKYVLSAAVPASFDRLDIQMGGVANALASLRLYDVRMVAPRPQIELQLNGIPDAGPVCIRDVGKIKLQVTNIDPCATYYWYKSDNTPLPAGTSFSPVLTTAGTYTWYVEAVRNGCSSQAKNRIPVTVKIVPVPGNPLLTIQPNNP